MSKLNKIGAVVVSSILLSVVLAGCSSTKEEAPAKETIVVEAEEEEVKEEIELTLAEQGFTIENYETDPIEGNVLLQMKGPGGEYFGMLNSNFEWVLKPQEFLQIEQEDNSEMQHNVFFTEGLMRVAVQEDREIRANRGRYEEMKYGYMNTKGEWAIEPSYRTASPFSNGVAVVTTIEEDRDDLSNARQIVIDKTGKEIFELVPTYNISESPDENYENERFSNGYLKTSKGVYDSHGKFYKTDFLEGVVEEYEDSFGNMQLSYEIIDDKIVSLNQDKIAIYDLLGELLKSVPLPKEVDGEPGNLFTSEELAKESKFIVGWSNNRARILDLAGKVHGEPIEQVVNEEQIGYSAPYLFIKEEQYIEETEDYEDTIIVYNYNGEKVVTLPSEAKSVHNRRYWVEGNEYDKLISFDGQVLIDEEKKVITDHKGHLEGDVISVKRRLNPEDPEMTDVLLNTVTFETITINELLNK